MDEAEKFHNIVTEEYKLIIETNEFYIKNNNNEINNDENNNLINRNLQNSKIILNNIYDKFSSIKKYIPYSFETNTENITNINETNQESAGTLISKVSKLPETGTKEFINYNEKKPKKKVGILSIYGNFHKIEKNKISEPGEFRVISHIGTNQSIDKREDIIEVIIDEKKQKN